MTEHDLYIAGAWVKGASYRADVNPSNLDDSVGDFAQADEARTSEAIAAAGFSPLGQALVQLRMVWQR